MPPSFGDASVKGVAGLSSGETDFNVGKVASALLAKHVRTLEVLHSLQKHNAQLRQEVQEKVGEEEVKRRIAEAIAAAVDASKDLTEELQLQREKLRQRVAGLDQELVSAKKASENLLAVSRSQMEDMRELNLSLEKKCKDLEFEASCNVRQRSLQGDLESQLREASVTMALAEERAGDLTRRLTDRESVLRELHLRLQESDDKVRAMKVAETTFSAKVHKDKARIVDIESQARDLQKKLEATEVEHQRVGVRFEQALQEVEKSREEHMHRANEEQQELLVKVAKQKSRANAAETKLSEERKRFQRLRHDAKRRLEDEERRYKEALVAHTCEREQLLARIDALSREIESMRVHMNNNRSQFSKYVEAKTENTQLRKELDGMRESVAMAPHPPHRSHSLGGGSSSILGGDINKTDSVERLRQSISILRGHPTNTTSTQSSSGGRGSKSVIVRRHSGHNISSPGGGGGSGWTGTSPAPSYEFLVSPAGFSNNGTSAGGDETATRQRGARPTNKLF